MTKYDHRQRDKHPHGHQGDEDRSGRHPSKGEQDIAYDLERDADRLPSKKRFDRHGNPVK